RFAYRPPGVHDFEMPDSSVPATNSVSVPTGGWTWFDRSAQLTVLVLLPLGIVMLAVISGPRYPVDFLPRALIAVIILVAVDVAYEGYLSVRRVDIDSRGVTFRYLFHSEFGFWYALGPSPRPPSHDMWAILRIRLTKGTRSIRGHWVTLEQARAILSHPACPEW